MKTRHAPPPDAGEMDLRPSHDQHKYYRAVILPAMAKEMGYESHAECHAYLKRAFLGLRITENPMSMAEMTKEESSRFLSWVIRNGDEIGAEIPPAAKRAVAS